MYLLFSLFSPLSKFPRLSMPSRRSPLSLYRSMMSCSLSLPPSPLSSLPSSSLSPPSYHLSSLLLPLHQALSPHMLAWKRNARRHCCLLPTPPRSAALPAQQRSKRKQRKTRSPRLKAYPSGSNHVCSGSTPTRSEDRSAQHLFAQAQRRIVKAQHLFDQSDLPHSP